MKRAVKTNTTKKTAHKEKSNASRMNDPIRIVPLHMPGELWQPSPGIAAPPAAQVTYRGGPLLTAVKVFTIFWGQAWKTSPASALPDQINQFFKFVLSSSLIDQLSEYSRAGQEDRARIIH